MESKRALSERAEAIMVVLSFLIVALSPFLFWLYDIGEAYNWNLTLWWVMNS